MPLSPHTALISIIRRIPSALKLLFAGIYLAILTQSSHAQIRDYVPSPPQSYLERNKTPYFDFIPSRFSKNQAFKIKITKLLERNSCFPKESFHSEVKPKKITKSIYAIAAVIAKYNTSYSSDLIKICMVSNTIEEFHVNDEGLIIADPRYPDSLGFIVPIVHTLQNKIDERRSTGGWCIWTYCLGGNTQ